MCNYLLEICLELPTLRNLIVKQLIDMNSNAITEQGRFEASSMFIMYAEQVYDVDCTKWMLCNDSQKILSLAMQLIPIYVDVDCIGISMPVVTGNLQAKFISVDFGDYEQKLLMTEAGLVCDVEIIEGFFKEDGLFVSMLKKGIGIKQSCQNGNFNCLDSNFTQGEVEKARQVCESFLKLIELI